jgi:hypothetical protein
MGDSIINLSTNKKLEITDNDASNLFNFFDVDLNANEKTVDNNSTKSLVEIIKFVALFTILFYICIHPASIGRFTDNPFYKQLLQTSTFAVILFLYLYFNK